MSAVDQRKVQSIYEAIDGGAYKIAVQTCNKLLKKTPNNLLLKSLKALALVRASKVDKVDESVKLCDEVLAARPTDEDVLHTLTLTLRHLERHEDIITLYDEAFKQSPHNEELGSQAFMAMVRIGNWKTAQQISLKMSKNFPSDTRYISWSVQSAVLQACDPPTADNMRPVLFSLALRLLEQLPAPTTTDGASPATPSPDKIHLHLQILLSSNPPKYQEAFDLLQREDVRSLSDLSLVIDELRRPVWHHLQKYSEERELCEKRFADGDRNWVNFLGYLESVSGLAAGDATSAVFGEAAEFLQSLAAKDGKKERGSHLALLELEKRKRASSSNGEGSLLGLLKEYFTNFSDKAACFEDLKPYVDVLSTDDVTAWIKFLKEQDPDVTTTRTLLCTLSAFKLLRYSLASSEEATSVETETQRGIKYFNTYIEALRLVGLNLESSELQPADDLALLSANCLISAWALGEKKDTSLIHQALVVLEYAAKRSIHNYQFTLLLVRLYLILGAPSLAVKHYRRLKVKSVQHDTLSHFILNRATTFSAATNGDLSMIQEALVANEIYSDNGQQTPDMLVQAFQHEKYSQIPSFIEFEDRLDRSLHRNLVRIEHVRMRFAVEPPQPELLAIEISELDIMLLNGKVQYDNRDYSVLPNYQPKGVSIEEQTAMGPRPGVHWIRTFVKLYILALNRAVSPHFHSPHLAHISPEDLSQLTPTERTFVQFSNALASWLVPSEKPKEKSAEEEAAAALKKYDPSVYEKMDSSAIQFATSLLPLGPTGVEQANRVIVQAPSTTANGDAEANSTAQRATVEDLVKLIEELQAQFKTVLEGAGQPWEILHAASLLQETLVVLNLYSGPLNPNANGKQKKADPLWNPLKTLKSQIITILKQLTTSLAAYGKTVSSSDSQASFTSHCEKLLESFAEDDEKLPEFAQTVARDLAQSQAAIFSTLGAGIAKFADGKRPVLVV